MITIERQRERGKREKKKLQVVAWVDNTHSHTLRQRSSNRNRNQTRLLRRHLINQPRGCESLSVFGCVICSVAQPRHLSAAAAAVVVILVAMSMANNTVLLTPQALKQGQHRSDRRAAAVRAAAGPQTQIHRYGYRYSYNKLQIPVYEIHFSHGYGATWHMEETHLHMNVAMITNFARKNVQFVVLFFVFVFVLTSSSS